MSNKSHYSIKKAKNGYVVQAQTDYGSDGEAEVYITFEDAVARIAEDFSEDVFAKTVKQAQALTQSLTDICSTAVAPKLLAIEAKINPGIENLDTCPFGE